MSNELLKYLKSSVNQNWLWCDSFKVSNKHEGNPRKYTNYELDLLIQAKVRHISTISAKKSSRLVVFIVEKNPIEFIAAFLAGVIAEVNLFLCDPAWQQQEWQQVLKLVQPDLIYGDFDSSNLITQVSNANGSDLPSQPLIMIPTGGTSGKVNFAIHSWDTLSASVAGFKKYFNCQEINSFCTLPLYHVSGLMQLMRSLTTHGNLYICPYKIKTKPVLPNKQDWFISLVPTQLQFLIESIPEWLAQFQTVLLGGAPATRSLLATAREYNIPIALTYGMTETASGIVTLKPQDFLAGNYSSGQVLPHAEVKIRPVVSNQIVSNQKFAVPNRASSNHNCQDNQIGLIEISSTSLCLGYYPQVLATAQPFVTDDLGYFDREGYLHLIGRNSQKIITGGENVFPAEVESVIYSTELVKDVCVIGIPDQKWGQAVTAFYIPLESELNLSLIKQKVRLQLAKYKQPKNWIEVNTIPRNNRGKINYQILKAIALQKITNR